MHTDDWEETFSRLTEAENPHILPEIYVEEKLYNRLLQYVDENCSIYILHTYESVLVKHFPEYILEKYSILLEKSAKHTASRKTYAEWAATLNKMATWRGGKKCVANILKKWKTTYKNRPAMLDEIKKVKIGSKI